MYSYNTRVRYSETAPNGRLSPLALLDYYQDVATFHSEDIGLGLRYLKERNIFWALNSWQVDIMKLPRFGEDIVISTIPYEVKGFIGKRNFIMKNKDGEVLSAANSIWTLFNAVRQMPERASDEIKKYFGNEERIDMEYLSRKVNPAADAVHEVFEPFAIGRHNLDTNNHVNNSRYVYMAWDYIGKNKNEGEKADESFQPDIKRFRAEYRKQAFLNDIFVPHIYTKDNLVLVSFTDEDDKVYANIEFWI